MIKSWANEANDFDGPFEILEDWRWGFRILYMGRAAERLLIDPRVYKCAVFIDRKVDGQTHAVATAFFVKYVEAEIDFYYLVAAAHVIRKTLQHSDDQIVYLRFQYEDNKKRPKVRSNASDWKFHPTDQAADVAVLPMRYDPRFHHSPIEMVGGAAEVEVRKRQLLIDVGTDVFMVGLFTRHVGQGPNILPIVRTGSIARICNSKERFKTREDGRSIKGHLLEIHSFGGLSGAPVFACPLDATLVGVRQVLLQTLHPWMGLISGHWQVDEDDDYNYGIAIMTPKELVVETIMQNPTLLKMRKKETGKHEQKDAVTLDDADVRTQKTHAPKKEDRIAIPIPTRGQFERDLAKATRKRNKD
jgi:hypothetical protein